MRSIKPEHTKEEFAHRGEEIYRRDLKSKLEPGAAGQFVVIDIESGDYEIDTDEILASDRLLTRCPRGQFWLRRVGQESARRFGLRNECATS
jgi:hypothetical protein